MARWTQTIQDQQHIAKVNEQMPIGGIAVITLLDGTRVEGVLRRMNAGNNAGRGGWSYYGECEVEDKSRQRWVIDYLDIKSAERIWNENIAAEYEELGLITIVRQPV
ncbi:hypothetical protein [Ectopseudomonas khazarica]|jgi:hypothetical protein|uniref:hypothetical protein n=1 Tax=Ectopseudomonas khazarica TaxID=2502979 RepID=UPI0037C6C020